MSSPSKERKTKITAVVQSTPPIRARFLSKKKKKNRERELDSHRVASSTVDTCQRQAVPTGGKPERNIDETTKQKAPPSPHAALVCMGSAGTAAGRVHAPTSLRPEREEGGDRSARGRSYGRIDRPQRPGRYGAPGSSGLDRDRPCYPVQAATRRGRGTTAWVGRGGAPIMASRTYGPPYDSFICPCAPLGNLDLYAQRCETRCLPGLRLVPFRQDDPGNYYYYHY